MPNPSTLALQNVDRAVSQDRDRLISVPELCDYLRISPATLYRLHKSDPRFPRMLKIGSSTRFQQSDVNAFVRNAASPEANQEGPADG